MTIGPQTTTREQSPRAASLAGPLEPLTRGQRLLLAVASIIVALTRLPALAKSLWDWDEAQFVLGLRHYDVTRHFPHPPGFPLYILAGRFLRLFVHDDFRALRSVTLIAAFLLLPALFALARELRFPFATALCAGLLAAFFPNLWFYGGTAFSDFSATVLVIGACALLLRGCRDSRSYVAGAVLLGIACGFRSQNILFGSVPFLLATWFRMRAAYMQRSAQETTLRSRLMTLREPLMATAILGTIIVVSYLGAALASASIRGYIDTCKGIQQWMREVDSYLSPTRPPLRVVAHTIFVTPMRGGLTTMLLVDALALVSIVCAILRRKAGVLVAVLIFVPFEIFAWLMLDWNSLTRYAIAYVPIYALLAADGAGVLVGLLPRGRSLVQFVLIGAIAGRFAAWTLPALRDVHRTLSPPAAGMEWVRDKTEGFVCVDDGLRPWSNVYIPSRIAESCAPGMNVIAEGTSGSRDAMMFTRDRDRTWDIARRRYFEVFVEPMSDQLAFREGWYGDESSARHMSLWMGARSRTLLPVIGPRARLTLAFTIPSNLVALQPTVEVRLNGTLLDRIHCTTESTEKTWDVASPTDVPNELIITTNMVANPAKLHVGGDTRDLGIQLTGYQWRPLP